MPIIISGINSALDADKNTAAYAAAAKIKMSLSDFVSYDIYKTSLDARKQNDIHFVHSVYAKLCDRKLEQHLCDKYPFCNYIDDNYPKPVITGKHKKGRVAVVGLGPAGLFCALVLSENGYRPVVFERGESIEKRAESVNGFWNGGPLNVSSNVQFGEGGAGTFSDGKLTTRIKDPLCRYVLERFCEFGAPPEILTKAKPHIGTDNLRKIITGMRERLILNGGEVHFSTLVDDIEISDGEIRHLHTRKGVFSPSAVVMAVGNSSRDTFEMLYNKQIFMEPKPFSVGVRIEHLQKDVNESLYGKHADNPLLPQGEYQLSHREGSRAVYTFCMCPGGYVVPSSSEENSVVTNGMSEFMRDGKNANCAVAVSVSPSDFGTSALDGMNYARALEQKAFRLAGSDYKAPATTTGGFLSGRPGLESSVEPTYARGLAECDFNELFDEKINTMLRAGLEDFSKKMKCFGSPDAIMTAPETRTSSPLRIVRNEAMESLSVSNLYPCGEGAGYAGGIMSAAVDGIKAAYRIMEKYAPEKKI
ncbi:MAG: NAD(P)/FAD-dependent oxidoreductase [Oscillospiraceae bacterium]|nr:NAD(P)/FAD-dependent oxidoreductase [Oscillospiraceae bacterium]